MDYLAHALWSYITFHRTRKPLYGVLFGILPDTVSWVPYFFFNLLTGGMPGRPVVSSIPQWVMTLYGISHSVLVFFCVAGIAYLFHRTIPIYVWAWLLHILIDIPTHTSAFLPTPFLWPFANFAFPGISWGTPWFMALNYSVMIIALIVIFLRKRFKGDTLESKP